MYFQQGKVTLVKLCMTMYRSLENVTPGHPGWIWFVQCPGLIYLTARWSVPATPRKKFRPVWMYSEFIKVCWIHFFSWESFTGFYILCYPISTIPDCLFTFRIRISWKKLCWKGSLAAKIPSYASYTLCITLYEGWIWSNYHWKIRLGTKDNNN